MIEEMTGETMGVEKEGTDIVPITSTTIVEKTIITGKKISVCPFKKFIYFILFFTSIQIIRRRSRSRSPAGGDRNNRNYRDRDYEPRSHEPRGEPTCTVIVRGLAPRTTEPTVS